jgi:hypothetical protein
MCHLLQEISSIVDNLIVSCVIESLDLSQLKSILGNTVTYYGC